MNKLLIVLVLASASVQVLADPPCVPQPPYYTGSDKYDWQVLAAYPRSRGFGHPGRQAYCEDWWYLWMPGYFTGQYWIPAGYNWISDSSQQGRIVTITRLSPYGQVLLKPNRSWYDSELNRHIYQTAVHLNNSGIWWTWDSN